MIGLFEVLFDASVRSIVWAAVVYLPLWALRVRDAAGRHSAWTAVMCAMFFMPLLPGLMPPLPVAVPASVEPLTVFVEPVRVIAAPRLYAQVASGAVPDWNRVWMAVYFGGAFLLLIRVLPGWLAALRLTGASRFVPSRRAYESPRISAPLTIGVFRPQVFLPLGWRHWPADALRAVLLQERAHVSRRDTAVAVPRELGARRRYAEVLVEMARHRFEGFGFGGMGLLEKRVDRVLGFAFAGPGSGWRKAALAMGCAVAIAASCSRAVAPLRENPMTAERERKSKEYAEIQRMTPEQAAESERVVAAKPDDLETRGKLLTFYAMSGDYVLGRDKVVPARRAHILWLISNHPEHELAGSWGARIFPTDNDKDADPAGYEEAKALWLRAVARPPASAAVLANASTFFQVADKVLAEELLLRAQGLEPGIKWSLRRGHLYYEVLMGSNASMPMGVIRSISLAEAHGRHANAVREKLAASNDAALLTATGQMLVDWGSRHSIDFDAAALGRSYLERALQLDPQSVRAREVLRILRRRDEPGLTFRMPGRVEAYEAVAALQDGERLEGLARLAEASYIRGDTEDYYRRDAAAAKAAWAVARKCADEALRLAPAGRGDRSYSAAVYGVNMIAGMLAMRDGNQSRAVRHLLAAVDVPPSEDLAYSFDYATLRLAGWLLKDGEREQVITFLERLAVIHVSQRAYLLESAELIRKGVKPLWYPRHGSFS